MFNFVVSFLKTVFGIAFKKQKDVIYTFLLLKKENEIMKRHLTLLLLNRKHFLNGNADLLRKDGHSSIRKEAANLSLLSSKS